MENSRLEILARLDEELKELPENAKLALCWALTHWQMVEGMCKNPEMTNEEIEKYKEEALKKEDYIMLTLLCAAQTYINSDETIEQ